MGIGSILGTIGGIVGAPFTGGASMEWGPALGNLFDGVSSTFGGGAKAQQTQQNTGDQLKIALENAKLNRDKYATAAPGQRLGTSIRASLANNFTPASINWGPNGFKPGAIAHGQAQMPTIQGGAGAGMANLSPDTKSLANQVMHDEMVSQMKGGASGGNADEAMPTGIGQTSTAANVMGGIGMGGSIMSLIQKFMQQNKNNSGEGNATNPDDWSAVEG